MLTPAASYAADAANPYGNVNHANDAGNDTGDSQVDQLNQQQLSGNGIPRDAYPSGAGPSYGASPPGPGYGAPPPGYGAPPPGYAPPAGYAPPVAPSSVYARRATMPAPPGYPPPGYRPAPPPPGGPAPQGYPPPGYPAPPRY